MNKITAVVLAAILLLTHGCGGSSGETTGLSAAGAQFTDASGPEIIADAPVILREALYAHMQNRYLWYEKLPAIDIHEPQYANLMTLAINLRKSPEDRFSSVVDAVSFGARIERGLTQSFGFRFKLEQQSQTDSMDLRVALVDDFGSVAAAGIERGDRIIAAEGVPIDELGLNGFMATFDEPGLGVQRTLTVRHADGTDQQHTITRREYALNPVRQMRVFDVGDSGRQALYVQVTEFIELTGDQLQSFRSLATEVAAEELILDLRYNPGGLVRVARDLASSIYSQSQATDLYSGLRANNKHTQNNVDFLFKQFDDGLRHLERVFILTTRSSCSASEQVINGLEPFLDVVTIGTDTCGKPYASRPYVLLADKVNAHVLDSRSVNADGNSDYFEGLAADCVVTDEALLPFSSADESLISAALFYIQNDSCPLTVVASEVQQQRSIRKLRDPGLLLDVDATLPADAIYSLD